MSDNTTDFFDNVGGTGAPTGVLKGVGDFVHGEIVQMKKRDHVPYGKDDPEPDDTEPDGKRKELVVIIQTANRNWAGVSKVPKVDYNDPNSAEKPPEEDDGKRAIYVPNRSNIQYAIGQAVQASKSKFEVGGTLGVKIVNLKDTGKGNPLKEHQAVYQPKPAAADFFPDASEAAAPAPAATPAPAAAPAPTPTPEPAPAQAAAPAQQDPWAAQPATSEPPF